MLAFDNSWVRKGHAGVAAMHTPSEAVAPNLGLRHAAVARQVGCVRCKHSRDGSSGTQAAVSRLLEMHGFVLKCKRPHPENFAFKRTHPWSKVSCPYENVGCRAERAGRSASLRLGADEPDVAVMSIFSL